MNRRLFKIVGLLLYVVLNWACGKESNKQESIEMIHAGRQDSIFQSLVKMTNYSLPEPILQDSLAFLILPVEATCPSCRKKTIDSIMQYREKLPERHFIILSADGGRKTINSFFKEQDYELPYLENRLFIDSVNQALKLELYSDRPTIYYTVNQKAYKKVSAIPATVREDLREFFSGHRDEKQMVKK